jgi:hypothetical protein
MATVNTGQRAGQIGYGPDSAFAVPAQYEVPVTGFSLAPRSSLLVLNPAGTLAAGTIVLPDAPLDGQRQAVTSTGQITALTVTAGTGDSVDNAPSEIPADGYFELVYVASELTWFRCSALQAAI